MAQQEKVIKVKSPTGRAILEKMQSQKRAIDSFFKGDISVSELNDKGVKFVRTI